MMATPLPNPVDSFCCSFCGGWHPLNQVGAFDGSRIKFCPACAVILDGLRDGVLADPLLMLREGRA